MFGLRMLGHDGILRDDNGAALGCVASIRIQTAVAGAAAAQVEGATHRLIAAKLTRKLRTELGL